MNCTLNWKELALWTQKLAPQVENLFIDGVIVPERPHFPNGYLKNEWLLRLSSRGRDTALILSLRPRSAYLGYLVDRGLRAAKGSTQSAFGLALSKYLKGSRLLKIEALHRERAVILKFESGIGLVLILIPAVPDAFLIQEQDSQWIILARNRQSDAPGMRPGDIFTPPDGSKAPDELPVREELVAHTDRLGDQIEKELDEEAFEQRKIQAHRLIRDSLKHSRDRMRQAQTAVQEAEREPDWQRYGDLLKGALGAPPPLIRKKEGKKEMTVREVTDFVTDQKVEVPCEAKLSIQEQVTKFYQLHRRRSRRLTEAQTRFKDSEESTQTFETLLNRPLEPGNWKELEQLERQAGIVPASASATAPKHAGRTGTWHGKTFISKDGLMIRVGRTRDENLELTFKLARGNDLWLHLQGRPGAHVVVHLQPGKSAPLETLLDAATLAVYYSGNGKLGKTEVDYTYKKHVRRIKDSTEASYTHNKTIILEPDAQRLKRLLGGE